MQLARNLFLSFEKTVSRKLSEIDLARELEKTYSKNEILILYLNTVNFGHGAYGIWTAAQEYFSKTPDQLSFCLLYTSAAADERSSVDLGGRGIIKKKTNTTHNTQHTQQSTDCTDHSRTHKRRTGCT